MTNLRKQIGHMHCFCYNSKGVPAIVIGPDWPKSFSLFIIAFLVISMNILMMFKLVKSEASIWFTIVGIILLSTGVFCLLYTFLANPGIPNKVFTDAQIELQDKDRHPVKPPGQKDVSLC